MTQKKERPYGFWNWGTGIAIAMILAASAMIFLVYKSYQVDYYLVEKDYYAAELQYDKKKAATQNASELSEAVSIHQNDGFIIIQFPKECIGKSYDGELVLYRPSDKNKDIEVPFELDEDGIVMISDTKLVNGKYILKGNWMMDDKEYHTEQSFFYNR